MALRRLIAWRTRSDLLEEGAAAVP
jgi:hypothetical protein